MSLFAEAFQKIERHFIFPERTIYQSTDFNNPHARLFAMRTDSAQDDGPSYSLISLATTQLDMTRDFSHTLTTGFQAKLRETFNNEIRSRSPEYMVLLFQQLVHDNQTLPQTIDEVVISNIPKQVRSEFFASSYKRESRLYSAPLDVFEQTYENWDLQPDQTPYIDGNFYPIVDRNDLQLKRVMTTQNYEYLLRLLIKFYLIEKLTQEQQSVTVREHPFFRVTNFIQSLARLQQEINEKLTYHLGLNAQQIIEAQGVNSANRFELSPYHYHLAQRVPLLRLLVGHANFDVNYIQEINLTTRKWLFIQAYNVLNLNIVSYFIKQIKSDLLKSRRTLNHYMHEMTQERNLVKKALKLCRATFLALSFIPVSVFVSISGISAIPFTWLKRRLRRMPGDTVEVVISCLESAKDLAIVYAGLSYCKISLGAAFTFSLPLFLGAMVGMLGIYGAIAIVGKFLHKSSRGELTLANAHTLQASLPNPNHAPTFRELLTRLSTHLDKGTSENEDVCLLEALSDCQLPVEHKAQLKRQVEGWMLDTNVQQKEELRFELAQIDNPQYLPSRRLVNRLRVDFRSQLSEPLRSAVDNIHQVYATRLAAY